MPNVKGLTQGQILKKLRDTVLAAHEIHKGTDLQVKADRLAFEAMIEGLIARDMKTTVMGAGVSRCVSKARHCGCRETMVAIAELVNAERMARANA